MELVENNYKEKINAYTHQDWYPLFILIPKIENTSKFSKPILDENGAETLYDEKAPIVSQFLKIVYDIPILVIFNWQEWKVGREIINTKNFNFESIDIPTKCKLITAIVRYDRFCEGSLVSEFESGIILKILKSIEKQINKKMKSKGQSKLIMADSAQARCNI